MENGPDTVIGSGGARLSGGQAQRLALARPLAHPRPVLVLDDPFSALDRSTEDMVFAHLQDYAKDKVVFLISHRLYHSLPTAAAGDLHGERQSHCGDP